MTTTPPPDLPVPPSEEEGTEGLPPRRQDESVFEEDAEADAEATDQGAFAGAEEGEY